MIVFLCRISDDLMTCLQTRHRSSSDEDDDDGGEYDDASLSNNRAQDLCHHCGRLGHWRWECPHREHPWIHRIRRTRPFDGVSAVILSGCLGVGPMQQGSCRYEKLRDLLRAGGAKVYAVREATVDQI